jgi:hypothetical protein
MSTRYQDTIFCVSGPIWRLQAIKRIRTLQGIATLNPCLGRDGHSYGRIAAEGWPLSRGSSRKFRYRNRDEVEHEL